MAGEADAAQSLQAVFLAHFAATCDVRASAAEAGMCVWTVYDHRRRDSAFAAAWQEAERLGCALLEAEAVRQRIEAMERIAFDPGKRVSAADRSEADLEFWRTMHHLREHKRSLAGIGKGRPLTRWSFDDAMELLKRRLIRFGVRSDEESGPGDAAA